MRNLQNYSQQAHFQSKYNISFQVKNPVHKGFTFHQTCDRSVNQTNIAACCIENKRM